MSDSEASSPQVVSRLQACAAWSAQSWAILLLRFFLGLRFLVAGLGKFHDPTPGARGGSWHAYKAWSETLTANFVKTTFLPQWLLMPYTCLLGPLEILLGGALLVGYRTQHALAALGLLCISLGFGQMLIQGHSVVADIGVHLVLIVLALVLVPYDVFKIKSSIS